MIPEHLDDGFTTEVTDGLYARPMLWRDKQKWKGIPAVEQAGHLYSNYVESSVSDFEQHKAEVIQVVLGYTSKEEEQDFQDLHDSVYLHVVLNPGLSELPCSTCREWCVDHEKGTIYIGPSGQPTPLPRGTRLPCETQSGCVKRHWADPLGLSEDRWARCWRHYWTYRDNPGTMSFDPIFLRNKKLLDWIVDYGRDRRFDPFAGGSSGRRTTNDPTTGTPRPDSDRTCCTGGGCSSGACSPGCPSSPA